VRRTLTRYRAVLRNRNVALLLAAGIASEIGDWFNTVALISLSFRFGDGALGVGGMLAVRMVTRLLLQGPAGTLVDRRPGRRMLFASQLLMAVIAASFVILVRFPELWLLLLLVILLEGANCVARPAFMVELKAEAPEEQRAAANGVLFASMTTAQLIGPVLGAVALAPFGTGAVFALNGLTFLAVAAAVTQLRGGLRGADARTSDSLAVTPLNEIPEGRALGYAWLLRRQDLGLYTLVSLCLALLVQATIALFVVRANTLGLGDGGVGLFYAAVALGSIVGSIVAGARAQSASPLFPVAVAMGLTALALAAFGAVGTVVLALAALVVAGFTTDFYEVAGLTYFQHAIPDGAYGRFISLFLLALSAGGLIGALAGPTLEQTLGVAASLSALAVPGVALALILAFMAKIWQSAQPMPGG
jgi:predicted MFS family arabinose efflux permease